MSAFLHTQPAYYWALLALLSVVVLVAFAYFRWSIRINGRRDLRRTQLAFDRDVFDLDYRAWKIMRSIEEWSETMERAINEHPDRIAALMSEDVPLLDAITAVAS